MGIKEYVGGMPLVPSSHSKIIENHLHNHHRCCT
jgi:hypothetical protein